MLFCLKRSISLLLLLLSKCLYAQPEQSLKPGDVYPWAKVVEVDDFCAISGSVCVVHKGNLQALMNMKGELVVPWGKYNFTQHLFSCNQVEAYGEVLRVEDPITKKVGFLTTDGKIAVPLKYLGVQIGSFDVGGLCMSNQFASATNDEFINTQGKVALSVDRRSYEVASFYNTTPRCYNDEYNSRHIFLVKDVKSQKYGYIDKKGAVAIPAVYDLAASFSEGMAAVCKKNDFGAFEWGFIDMNGKLVIPYKFSVKPGSFHNRLALVKPKTKTTFDYAYIDRSGEPKIFIGSADKPLDYFPVDLDVIRNTGKQAGNLDYVGMFLHGYAFWQEERTGDILLMDTTGRLITFNDYAKKMVLDQSRFTYKISFADDKGIHFNGTDKQSHEKTCSGVIDFSGDPIFQPIEGWYAQDLYSNYCISACTVRDSGTSKIIGSRLGVVDEKGVFIIVRSDKKSTW